MARPKKDNAEYFPHDVGMRNDDRVKALRKKFKVSGYGIWNMLIEYLGSKDHFQFEYNDFTLEIMSGDFDVDVKEIQEVISYCLTLGLLQQEEGFIRCKTLEKRLEPVLLKRKWSRSRVSVPEMPQSKSKVKESKEKDSIDDLVDELKIITQDVTDLINSMCDYFSVKKELTSKLYESVHDFVVTCFHRNEMPVLVTVFETYKAYKARSDEKIHNIRTWIGTKDNYYQDGQWKETDWNDKLLKYKQNDRTGDKKGSGAVKSFEGANYKAKL
jgi:hypothetical protein